MVDNTLQDTIDDSHWKNLNVSLRRVSSATNGKYDAIQEIEVCFLFLIFFYFYLLGILFSVFDIGKQPYFTFLLHLQLEENVI